MTDCRTTGSGSADKNQLDSGKVLVPPMAGCQNSEITEHFIIFSPREVEMVPTPTRKTEKSGKSGSPLMMAYFFCNNLNRRRRTI